MKNYKQSVDTRTTWQAWGYDMVLWTFTIIFDIFFREITPRGAYRIPRTGPVIFVAAPHANQFCDPIILMNAAKTVAGRRLSILIAAKSLKRKFVGAMARIIGAIGVVRSQDLLKPATGKIYLKDKDSPLTITGVGTKFTKECMVRGLLGLPNSAGSAEISEIVSDTEIILRKEFKGARALQLLTKGTAFRAADHVNQSVMFHKVFHRLSEGGCIAIFPEGGSHDRTDLLPLKAGVAIMALGAINEHEGLPLQIVPVGMNYFHPHRFRSRCVIEFGQPFSVQEKYIEAYKQGGDGKKQAVSDLLEEITNNLRTVTTLAPDYETLMVVQAARRLYRPPGKQLPLPVVVELNRRLLQGYAKYKDDERIIDLKNRVLAYNKELRSLGLKDHQVEGASPPGYLVFWRLLSRTVKLLALLVAALPGSLLFFPVMAVTKVMARKQQAAALAESTVKVKGNDVLATWKILIAMGVAPLVYTFYAILASYLSVKLQITDHWLLVYFGSYVVLPVITYSALVIGETGMDIFKSLRPLSISLFDSDELRKLQATREGLVVRLTELINTFGPEMYPDFKTYAMDPTKPPSGTEEEYFEDPVAEERIREMKQRKRESSTSSDSSNAISRVGSESDLSNMPLFSMAPDPYWKAPKTSSHSRSESSDSLDNDASKAKQTSLSSATGQELFRQEVTRRIQGSRELQQRSAEESGE